MTVEFSSGDDELQRHMKQQLIANGMDERFAEEAAELAFRAAARAIATMIDLASLASTEGVKVTALSLANSLVHAKASEIKERLIHEARLRRGPCFRQGLTPNGPVGAKIVWVD